jgi:hypothetical protein
VLLSARQEIIKVPVNLPGCVVLFLTSFLVPVSGKPLVTAAVIVGIFLLVKLTHYTCVVCVCVCAHGHTPDNKEAKDELKPSSLIF